MGCPSRNMSRKLNIKINPSDKQKQKYEEGKNRWCGYPFNDTFFENADEKDEEFDTKPKERQKL